jgi:hypothetical protein
MELGVHGESHVVAVLNKMERSIKMVIWSPKMKLPLSSTSTVLCNRQRRREGVNH